MTILPALSSRWKATPVIALGSAIALLIAGVVIGIYDERSYLEQKVSQVTVQGEILAASVTAALVFNDEQTAQEYVNALQVNAEVSAAGIYDADGNLIASYSRDGTPLPESVSFGSPQFENNYLHVVVPVNQNGAAVGAVYLKTITEPLERRLARYGAIMLLVTMASLVVAVLGTAHAALTKANAELEIRARELADALNELHAQIKERERAEEALRQSQKMEAIGQLSGGIAHDFNNLLTIVRGNLQLLQKRIQEGDTDVAQYVDLAMDGLNRASSVTQRVLAFSRRQPLSPAPVNLSQLILGMEELIRHSVGNRVTVATRLDAQWWVHCDVNQMENVILNLAINARDAMPEGGQLKIETSHWTALGEPEDFDGVTRGDYVKLTVTDTGAGMADEVRRQAIDPFFTTKPLGQGTGLGLSMIFGYVKQSKGFLNIESEVGKGTKVTILMPRCEAGSEVEHAVPVMEAKAGAMTEADGPPEHSQTILIVEDETLVRMLAVELISDEGYHVLEAADGMTALNILKSEDEIDLLMTDVKLPELTGYQLVETALELRPHMKILLMTGYTQDPMPQEMLDAGVKIIYKPFDIQELARSANELLKEKV